MDLTKYRKLIAAAIGFIVLFLKDVFNYELDSTAVDGLVNGIISLLSLWAVFAMRNKTTVTEARKSDSAF